MNYVIMRSNLAFAFSPVETKDVKWCTKYGLNYTYAVIYQHEWEVKGIKYFQFLLYYIKTLEKYIACFDR